MNPSDAIPTKLVTLACDAAWRPVKPSFQYADNTGRFTAKLLTLAVADDDGEILFHGFETRHAAHIFAASLGSKATIVTVEPYWHVAGFGCVEGYELTEPTKPAPAPTKIGAEALTLEAIQALALVTYGPTALVEWHSYRDDDCERADLLVSWGEEDEYGSQPYGEILSSEVLDTAASIQQAYREAARHMANRLAQPAPAGKAAA
jgi:hypothetical protein